MENNNNVQPQTVYLTYNNNNSQYGGGGGLQDSSAASYVLPVTILNNDNFVFYNNTDAGGDLLSSESCKEAKPEYIVNLDGGCSEAQQQTSARMQHQSVSVEGAEKMTDIYNRYPLLNKLVVKKIYGRNLLNIAYAFQELDRLHEIEENKRRSIKLVMQQPKKAWKQVKRIEGDDSLKTHIYSNKMYERMPPTLFKRVAIEENHVIDTHDERDGAVVESFLKERCKSFVSDEVNGYIHEDPKGMKRTHAKYRIRPETVTSSSDAGSIYPWRNKNAFYRPSSSGVDIDEDIREESDDNDEDEGLHSVEESSTNISSKYPWRNKFADSVKSEACFTLALPNDQAIDKEQPDAPPSTSEPAQTIQSNEPRFFRTKKLGYSEMKKRTYVSKELNQMRIDKKPMMSPMKVSELQESRIKGPSRNKRKSASSQFEYDDECIEDLPLKIMMGTPAQNINSQDYSTRQEKSACLNFFNESSQAELSLMPGCSTKKADEIISLRPFKSINDLYDKINKSSQLNDSIVDSCQDVLNMRRILSNLLSKCEKLKYRFDKVIAEALQNNELELPKSNNKDNSTIIYTPPKCLNPKMKLSSYQMVGLNWLSLLHNEKVNGILADEMGLGKTVQTIAFLAHLFETHADKGPHLVVVPSSTIGSWKRELSIWCPDLSVIVYHGSQDERKSMRLAIYEGKNVNFNVLLTTYAISTGTMEDRAMMKRVNFHYGVFDEAHMLKNMLSNRYKNLINFKVRRRLLLTGTPIQNNLLELISLLSFVMPDLFLSNIDLLKKLFQNTQSRKDDNSEENASTFEKTKIKQTMDLLQPFCLRRNKDQVLPQLPTKILTVVHLSLNDDQKRLYNTEISEMKKLSDKSDNTAGGAHTSQAGIVMNLRKISNHPLMVREIYNDKILEQISKDLLMDVSHENANFMDILEDLKLMNDFQIHLTCELYRHVLSRHSLKEEVLTQSNKFQYLSKKLPELIEDGQRILIFSQFTSMLDILEAFLNMRQFTYFRLDGQTPVSERQDLIDKFNSDESIKIFILSTKAGGLGINLTGASCVIFHDQDFNPFNDKQAEDRCHRVGQTKEVQVIKLISSDTIEEGIQSIANNKLKLGLAATFRSSDTANLMKIVAPVGGADTASPAKKVKFSDEGPNPSSAQAVSHISGGIDDSTSENQIDETNLLDIVNILKKTTAATPT